MTKRDTAIQFEGGEVLANLDDRTITALLLPYGEEGRTNIGRFQVEAGSVDIPADPAVVGLNLDHDRPSVVGRATKLWEEDGRGVFATFAIANTPEGDAALADAVSPTGKRRKVSAEFGPSFVKAGRLVKGTARLWGAALVEAGAFPSAQVLAADTPDDELPEGTEPPAADEPKETVEKFTDEITGEDGVTRKHTTTRTTRTEPDGEGGIKTTITEKTVIEEPEPSGTTEGEDPAVGVPNTLAAKPAITAPKVDLQQVFAAISTMRTNPHDEGARQVLAALSDIKISGAGALPAAGVLRENWLGALYQGIPYIRQYITLGKTGTDITAAGKKGYKVHRGTSGAPVDSYASTGSWNGNKAAIGSGTGWTETAASTLARFAFGEDIAREFYDLPGGAEVIEAFLKLIAEDHLVWSDDLALAAWVTAAGAPVAPSAAIPEDYPEALGLLMQGILAVKAKKSDNRRDKPTFAILNEAAYTELTFTPFEKIPEYIKFSVSTDQEGTADGDVRLVVGDIGIEDTPAVLVGAQTAIEFDELGNGPLYVDALNIANGGIDKAVHGYLQTFVVRPEAVVLVGTADA
jgi:hypothetical protein